MCISQTNKSRQQSIKNRLNTGVGKVQKNMEPQTLNLSSWRAFGGGSCAHSQQPTAVFKILAEVQQ